MSLLNDAKVLFILGPLDTLSPDLMMKKINEITVKMDRNWKVFAISGDLNCHATHAYTDILPYKFELHTVPTGASLKYPIARIIYFVNCILKGVKLVREKNIHVIMCKGVHFQNGSAAYIISRLTNRRCIIRVSDDTLLPLIFLLRASGNYLFRSKTILRIIGLTYRRIEHFLFKHVDWIITHGPMDYEKIKKVTDRITFVPLWVDIEKFRPLNEAFVKKFKRNLIGQKDMRIILFVGRLHPEKDIKTLLEAFRMVLDTYSDVYLMIIGHDQIGNYEAEYKGIARRLDIMNNTYFLGHILHDELPKYYNIADLYVLSSLREEWSNTIMEAMACRVPVIATEVGGNPYLVMEGETGFLVPSKNPRKLAEKIAFALENTVLTKKVSEEAFNEIKTYDKDKIGELVKSIIKNIIKT